MNSTDYIDLEDRFSAHNYHPLNVVLTRGEGVWVYDVDGKKYMDFLSAYSALNQGHCHPRIYQTLVDQAQHITLTSRAFRNDQFGLFAKKLTQLCQMEMMLPMNTGAEAVETAIKAARKWGYKVKGIAEDKAEIIVCSNNFHGRTTTIVGFSTEKQYQDGFGPFTPGFVIVPFGDIEALREAMKANTAAFMFEPIQGEGGILIPPEGYLKQAQDLCREHNVLFIADEVQTGLGRTGTLFAYQHESGVKPDLIIIGKALSGGFYPVSAVVGRKEVLGVFNPGDHGSTFGGNPLACAIAGAALDVIVDEDLPGRSADLGRYLMDKLKGISSSYVQEIRGRGLFIGIELKPEAGGARRFCEFLQQEGLLAKETHENVIRLAPPLIITKEEIDWALERIEKALTTL